MGSPSFVSPVRAVAGGSVVHSEEYASLARHASFFLPLRQDGTKTHPYVKFVSFEFPERNFGFDVEYVPCIERAKNLHDSVTIRLTVPLMDHDQWEAFIPGGCGEQDNKRLVLFKGPSQDFWMCAPERYHHNRACVPTRQANQATKVAIENDEDRKHTYWLLAFPDDVSFDNKIFSGEGSHVILDKAPQAVEAAKNPTEQKLLGMVLAWRIAQKGSSRRIRPEELPIKDDLKGMFA
jgi:hypothetical protein